MDVIEDLLTSDREDERLESVDAFETWVWSSQFTSEQRREATGRPCTVARDILNAYPDEPIRRMYAQFLLEREEI